MPIQSPLSTYAAVLVLVLAMSQTAFGAAAIEYPIITAVVSGPIGPPSPPTPPPTTKMKVIQNGVHNGAHNGPRVWR